jgi:hypothetical protein
VWLCYYSLWDVSSSQDERYGRWYDNIFLELLKNVLSFLLGMVHICNLLSLGMTGLQPNLPIRIPKHAEEDAYGSEEIPLRSAADGIPLRSPRSTEGIPLRSAPDGIPLRSLRGTESLRSTG